jgi:uncharacterized iron-regulated membrane protein
MKRYAFIPVLAIIALAGCTQKLDDQDRALLTDTHAAAEQAKADSAQAAADAKAAREAAEKADADANKADADAMAASTKADKMFQASQNK